MPSSHKLAGCPVVTPAQLMATEVITGPPGTLGRDMLDREARRQGRSFTPTVEVGLRGSALFFVLANAGVAILPRPFADLAGAGRAVAVPIVPSQVRRAFPIHRNAALSPTANALCLIVRASVGNMPACTAEDRETLERRQRDIVEGRRVGEKPLRSGAV